MISSLLHSDRDLIARPCGCGSMACPHCRNARAMGLRDRLVGVLPAFDEHCYFTTLTTSRDLSAEETYRLVSAERVVGEFCRKIGAKVWVCVTECHEDGYLHWHLVINVSEKLDYAQLHKSGKLKNAWRFGRVDFSYIFPNDKLKVLKYITNYITFTADEQKKGKKHMYADWILALSHFRFFSSSRGLFSSNREVREREISDDDCKCEPLQSYNKAKSLKQKISECHGKVNFFTACGEFVASVAISFDDFLKLHPLYQRQYCQRDGWRSAKACYYVSSDALTWLQKALNRLQDSGYLQGKLLMPFKIPLFGDIDWLAIQEDRFANDWSYHRDFFGRYSFGGSHV